MNLHRLSYIQAIVTLATFVLIIISPAAVPQALEIALLPNQFLLPYLIGANELALSFLSFKAFKMKDPNTLRLLSMFFIVFHASTGLVCAYALIQGGSIKIIGNIGMRVIMVSMFFYYGVIKTESQK